MMKKFLGFALGALAVAMPISAQIPAGVTFESIYDQAKVGFIHPTYIGPVPGDANQIVVVERAGKVSRLVKNGTMYDKVPWFSLDANTETHWDGAWNVEFHPEFAKNHLFYVLYRLKGTDTRSVIEEWTADANLGNPHKVRNVIYFNQKSIHSSGDMHFGKDGYLYSSQGDRDQRDKGGPLMTEMWGKVIRIDVNKKDPGLEYAIPDNPFKSQAEARPEIWALGFRMPWRFSFDALNGDMYLGDVGDLSHEEVNVVQVGKNYGAGKVEGNCATNCTGLTNPVLELPHGCVIGGFVYRNDPTSAFYGAYIYADYQNSSLNAFKLNDAKTGVTDNKKIATSTPGLISSMGVDAVGNIYASTYLEMSTTKSTHIYRLKHADLRPATTALGTIGQKPFAVKGAGMSARDAAAAGFRSYTLDGRPLRSGGAASGLVLIREPSTGETAKRISLP
ncbi:MAG: PQQ-dependent sugar dehydrogenase [Fibrobacteria bacterium]